MLHARRDLRGKMTCFAPFFLVPNAQCGTFAQDPAASCAGVGEVQEAFRALKAIKPEHIEAPKAFPGEEPDSTRVVLKQRYFGTLQVVLMWKLLRYALTAPWSRISESHDAIFACMRKLPFCVLWLLRFRPLFRRIGI